MKVSFIIGRAILAVLLMIGFYLLALGIAAGLLWIPYAEVVYAHAINLKLALICILGSLAIIWAIFPRFDKFQAPGPQLKLETHPNLFAQLQQVADATKQAMPAEVYLVPDVNAWVAQRGGIMGFRSRRVMGLGLPLMRVLTCSQFRAVLAHEFGHYHGGDTKIGPWIYKTRGAIGRTLESLGHRSWLQIPFRFYGMMFLRVTHAVSRRQEFVADELAARTVGAKALSDGLCNAHKVAPAFDYYWKSQCVPVLSAGYLPPLSEGFSRFVKAGPIAEKMDKHLEEVLAGGKSNPYDTHPALKDRIAAVACLPPGPVLAEDPPAVSLLEDVPELERKLMTKVAGAKDAKKLKAINWNEVGTQVYVPQWARLARNNAAQLKGITVESLPKIAGNLKPLGKSLRDFEQRIPHDEKAEGLANAVLGAALIVVLFERGSQLEVTPGHDLLISLKGLQIKPFELMQTLKKGELTAEAWEKMCLEWGVWGVDLGAIPPPKSGGEEQKN